MYNIMNKLVSIVIPTYKGADIISKTLDGVLKQTYKPIEIIVVDDNGKGTEEQIRTYEVVKNYKMVKYVAHDINLKGSAARNTGIANSTGDFIAFLDDDDVWVEDKIELQVNRLASSSDEYGFVYSPFVVVDENKIGYKIEGKIEGDILFDFLTGKVRIGSSLLMIKRTVLKDVIGFDESFIRHQDWEFIARILYKYKALYEPNGWTIKYSLNRNTPKKVDLIEKYRLYYLSKIDFVISKFSEKKKKKIYNYHYRYLAKEFLRRLQIGNCIKYIFKTSNPPLTLLHIIFDFFKKVFYRPSKINADIFLKKSDCDN